VPAILAGARNFIAHDDDGTDEEILRQAVAARFPEIVRSRSVTPPTRELVGRIGDGSIP
jgi:hypothetical protein